MSPSGFAFDNGVCHAQDRRSRYSVGWRNRRSSEVAAGTMDRCLREQ